jgi:tetratricopeptide (TPR) repeat protein
VTIVSPERLLKLLQSDDLSARRKAVEKLSSWGPVRALPHLLKVRREDPELRELATSKLKGMGAIVDLTPMGADSWFDQVKESSPAFETLCDVMGERFVGYALIVGVQISGLTIDQFTPANTLVEFRLIESSPPRTLRLPEFRRELAGWILSEAPEPDAAALPLDLAQAQHLIGVRYILLAPLHEMSLREVVLETPGRKPKASVVVIWPDERVEEVDVLELRRRLHAEVRAELDSVRDEPFELDFDLVDKAETAAKAAHWEDVIGLIGHWPGPLSMLSRMQMGANLDEAKRGRIGAALTYLARAYRATGRSAWAEELYRLGLQFSGDGPQGALLYRSLGESMIEERRFGESLGPLRRSLALGAKMVEIGPSLGLALSRCGRNVAAAAVLERTLGDGQDDPELKSLLARVYSSLGDAGRAWRDAHPDWLAHGSLDELPESSEEAQDSDFEDDPDDTTLEITAAERSIDYNDDDE